MYRRAALEGRGKGFSNPVSILGSVSASLMLVGTLVVTAAFITFGMNAEYTRRAIVRGHLTPQSGTVSISAPSSGNLILDVVNGQTISKGERLAEIRVEVADAIGVSRAEVEISNLNEELKLLSERNALFLEQAASLAAQRKAALQRFDAGTSLLEALAASKEEELALINDQLTRSAKLLSDNLSTQSNAAAIRQQYIIAQQSSLDVASRLKAAPTDRRQIELEWDVRALELSQARNALMRDKQNLVGLLKEKTSRQSAGVFAPIDGTVTFALAQQAEDITAGAKLLEITPANSDLVATLYATSSAVGFARLGDAVELRFDSFSFREHGVFKGKIINIDRTAQLPASIDAPIAQSEPVYRIIVQIPQTPISKTGQVLSLTSGMMLDASIVIDKKSLLFWLFDPIL